MDVVIDSGATNWQLAITTAMGNAADRPELLLQPWQMLELMPLLAELAVEGRKRGLFLQPASNIGYFGPYESVIRSWSNPCRSASPTESSSMAEHGRIPVPLRLCRGCRRFVRIAGRPDCVFCGVDLDSAESEHEANLAEMRRAAEALREALRQRAVRPEA